MIRILTTYLLIAVVLICPFLCLDEAACALGAPHQTGVCACAKHQGPSSGETPQPSDENETDCLCHGAIMDGARVAELGISAPLTINWLIGDVVLPSTELSLVDTSSEPPHQFPPFSTGRDVCVLTCSLLL